MNEVQDMGTHSAKRRVWPWVLGTAIVAPCVAFVGIGLLSQTSAPTRVVTPPSVSAAATPIVPPTQAPPTRVIQGIMDGNDYEVGVDVPAGKYHTDGKHDGGVPYASVNDANGHVVKWINVDGPSNVVLKNGQIFSTHGGVVWEYLGEKS